jgi:hypothetical protein
MTPKASLHTSEKRKFCWDLCSSVILRSVEWSSFTDVSGQRVGRIFKGQEVLDFLSLKDATETLVKDDHSTLRNMTEEHRSHRHRSGSLKSQKIVLFLMEKI